MKKNILFLILVFLINVNVYASTFTYERTSDNLRVPSDVVVDNNNIDNIMKTPSIKAKEKIYDFAYLLTDSEEQELYKSIKEYIDYTKIDCVIVTTRDLAGFTINEYTYNFYDYNNFKTDGVIFVIYMNNGKPEIFMGNSGNRDGKVFSIYNDYRIKETLKYVYEKNLRNNDYYNACDNYLKLIKAFYNIDSKGSGDYRVGEDGNLEKNIPWIELIILSLALTFVVIMVMMYALGLFKKTKNIDNFESYINKKTMKVKKLDEDLVDTIVGGK